MRANQTEFTYDAFIMRPDRCAQLLRRASAASAPSLRSAAERLPLPQFAEAAGSGGFDAGLKDRKLRCVALPACCVVRLGAMYEAGLLLDLQNFTEPQYDFGWQDLYKNLRDYVARCGGGRSGVWVRAGGPSACV